MSRKIGILFKFLLGIFCLIQGSAFLTASARDEKVFPTLQSLIDPKSLSELIASHYDFEETAKATLLSICDNDVYLVTMGNSKYVLRIYRFNKHWLESKDNYLFEMEWLNFLKEKNLPISYPIRQRNGEYIGQLNAPEGIRYWALFSFAEGDTEMDIKRAETFGKSIALIHLVSDDFVANHKRHHIDLEFLIDKPVHRIEQILNTSRIDDLNFLKELAAKLKSKIEAIPFATGEYGVIGGDFHGWNQHFNCANEVTHFDFDLCGYGWRAYDVAVFKWCRGENSELWEAFLGGYNAIRPLSSRELNAISAFVIIRQLWLMGSHTTYPDAPARLDKNYWDNRFKELKRFAESYQEFCNLLPCDQ